MHRKKSHFLSNNLARNGELILHTSVAGFQRSLEAESPTYEELETHQSPHF